MTFCYLLAQLVQNKRIVHENLSILIITDSGTMFMSLWYVLQLNFTTLIYAMNAIV